MRRGKTRTDELKKGEDAHVASSPFSYARRAAPALAIRDVLKPDMLQPGFFGRGSRWRRFDLRRRLPRWGCAERLPADAAGS